MLNVLSAIECTQAKPRNTDGAQSKPKPYKLFDGGGLFLLVNPNGSKLWRLKYRFGGREKLLALGPFHLVSLKRRATNATRPRCCYSTASILRPIVSSPKRPPP
jgi:hypothetical protein